MNKKIAFAANKTVHFTLDVCVRMKGNLKYVKLLCNIHSLWRKMCLGHNQMNFSLD